MIENYMNSKNKKMIALLCSLIMLLAFSPAPIANKLDETQIRKILPELITILSIENKKMGTVIKGTAKNMDHVSKYMLDLENSGFPKPELESMVNDSQTYTFVINLKPIETD